MSKGWQSPHRPLTSSSLWPCAGMSEDPEQPAWSSLPSDVWRLIVSLAVEDEQRQDADGWTQFCTIVGTLACVCKGLRSAVLGPDAGVLWDVMTLHSTYPGLSQQASRSLHRLAHSRARHTSVVQLYGSGWQQDELCQLVSSLTSTRLMLGLVDITSDAEASTVGSALAACSPVDVRLRGPVPVTLPASIRCCRIIGTYEIADEEARAAQLFACLQGLPRLESLTLGLPMWQLTSVHAAALRLHTQLTDLRLVLTVWHSLGQHAVRQLPSVPQLVLRLIVFDDSVTQLLLNLRGVQMCSLEVVEVEVVHYRLTAEDESHLARCSISEQLILKLVDPARRLRLPPELRVVYEQNSTSL